MKEICDEHLINPDQRESMECPDCNRCIYCGQLCFLEVDECPFCHDDEMGLWRRGYEKAVEDIKTQEELEKRGEGE